jgi:hypothetical protein
LKTALLVLALAVAGCAHREQPEADCAAANVPSALRVLPVILSLRDRPPAMLESGFVLCSPHEDRLLAASAALGAEGYSSYIGASKKGKCLRVARTHEANAAALEREVRTMCRIADAQRIAYRHWQVEIGGKSVRLKGERLTIDGKERRLGP